MTTLIELHYLPCIAYFAVLDQASEIVLEKNEYYVKQSYRNRCHIISARGKETLIIPLTSKHGKVFISEVRIDYSQKWLNNHWRTIRSAYGKAPFFEHYEEELAKTLFKRTTFLYDLTHDLLSMCLKWLKWEKVIKESEKFEKTLPPSVFDLRSAINAKDDGNLSRFYLPITYRQVFGNTFVANASVIDLIFCTGPEASKIIRASAAQKAAKMQG
ncbi:MAG TPA: WbqC family protein [Chryseolinea sp.]